MKKLLSFLWFFICFTLLFSSTASAYIDPSAMTYIIQIIASVAIAAGAAFGFYFRRIKRAFSRLKKDNAYEDDWDEDDDDDETGFGDYDLPGDASSVAFQQEATQKTQPQAAFARAQAEPGPVVIDPLPEDKYDETGGLSALQAENRELRRQLAIEREKVRTLIRALSIMSGDA